MRWLITLATNQRGVTVSWQQSEQVGLATNDRSFGRGTQGGHKGDTNRRQKARLIERRVIFPLIFIWWSVHIPFGRLWVPPPPQILAALSVTGKTLAWIMWTNDVRGWGRCCLVSLYSTVEDRRVENLFFNLLLKKKKSFTVWNSEEKASTFLSVYVLN